jgi:hypothetical protein
MYILIFFLILTKLFVVCSYWGPLASEGPQKHDLTMLLECNT